ncbi:MAG: hypothetical protein AAFU70_14540, partial [Planctomycetota bacterium]
MQFVGSNVNGGKRRAVPRLSPSRGDEQAAGGRHGNLGRRPPRPCVQNDGVEAADATGVAVGADHQPVQGQAGQIDRRERRVIGQSRRERVRAQRDSAQEPFERDVGRGAGFLDCARQGGANKAYADDCDAIK